MNIEFIDRKTGRLVSESPPAEGLMRFLYHNPLGRTLLLPLAKQKWVTSIYGRRMDRKSSTKMIPGFVEAQKIDMSESLRRAEEFENFNDFFARRLKASARPIGEGFVSPGDGKLLAFKNLSELQSFFVKGQNFTLSDFLADDELASEFQDFTMLILRLAPNDYHRFHFPYAGVPTGTTQISGSYYSVSPIALAKHFTKVFLYNKREYLLLDTEDKGRIIIAPVGATMVGSIDYTFDEGVAVEKGDEMGYFKFGGSTIVIIVDRKKLKVDQDILDNTARKLETAVRMGERIGF